MESTDMTEDAGPLSGLQIIDLSGMVAGGFATMQLADFGADVVMVEHPDYRDPIRDWTPFENDQSLWWKSLGRNKRCITLDLSTDTGRDLVLSLIEDADVVFENFRPGTMERWDLGYETLSDENSGIIMVRFSGYGQTGPKSKQPGFGTIAEGFSGWAHMNGYPDRKPLLPPISLADLTAAQFAVQATMFAIYERDIGHGGGSGKGQVVDVSLYEPLFRLFIPQVEQYDQHDTLRERTGNVHPNAAPRNIYETSDGHVTLSASSQRIFENVMTAIGQPDLIEDDRFATNAARVENREVLDEIIESWTCKRATEEVIQTMEDHDAVVGPIHNMSDIFEDSQYAARENIIEIEDEDIGELKTPAAVPKLSRTPGTVRHAGPSHGAHNTEVYKDELGLSKDQLQSLREDRVI